MIRFHLFLVICLLLPAACSHDDGPPLVFTNVRVLAPLPGRSASVAYMDILNQSQNVITIDSVSSPEFARAEMHETVLSDGIARMQALDFVAVEAASQLSFAPAGKHIMLLDPKSGLLPGGTVRLEIRLDDGGLLIIDAPVQTRNIATE